MGNDVKTAVLGVPFGTANARLRKMIIFALVQRLGEDVCYRCGKLIENIEELSIEHKKAWLQQENPKEAFYDLENIAFSHLVCNVDARSLPFKKYEGTPEERHREASRISQRKEYADPVKYAKHLEDKRQSYHRRKAV